MRNILIPITLFTVCVLPFTGCNKKGYTLVPVSGTVTSEGKPVPKLNVVFSPEPVGENNSVGPFSTGTTDANGKFTLTARKGDPGVMVGKHTVSFEYTDIGETAMQELRDELSDLQEEGSEEDIAEVKKKVKELTAKLKGLSLIHI